MSFGTIPLKLQMMLTTGMFIFGKISVGVRKIESTPITRMRIAITTNVYGRRNASLTIHIAELPSAFVADNEACFPNAAGLHDLTKGKMHAKFQTN
jgi:hypothetical protein